MSNESHQRSQQEIRSAVGALHISNVLVGRVLAVATSPVKSIAAARVAELAAHPQWFAKGDGGEMLITRAEHDALVFAGATVEGKLQRIHVHQPTDVSSTSVRCAACRRWIFCGHVAGPGECVCGQRFEIAFDAASDWSLPHGELCAECGSEKGFRPTREGRANTWRIVGSHQVACAECVCAHDVKQRQ